MVDKPIQIQESWECQFLIFPINFFQNSHLIPPLFYPRKIFQTKVLEEHDLELKHVPFKWKKISLKKKKTTNSPVLFSIFIVDFHISIDHGLATAGFKSQGTIGPEQQISCYCLLVCQSQD